MWNDREQHKFRVGMSGMTERNKLRVGMMCGMTEKNQFRVGMMRGMTYEHEAVVVGGDAKQRDDVRVIKC